MLTFEQMLKIRDGIIAKNKSLNFQSEMMNILYEKFSSYWKMAEKIAKQMTLSYDRSRRAWVASNKAILNDEVTFDKKPTKSSFIYNLLWAMSKEYSAGNLRVLKAL